MNTIDVAIFKKIISMSREVAARVWGIFNTNQWQGYLALGVCFSLVRIILTSRILLFRFQMSTMLVGQIVRWCGTQRKTASTLGWSPTSPTLAKKNPAQVHSVCGGGRGGDRQLSECHRRPQPFCEAKSSAKDLRVSTEQLLVLVPRSPVCLVQPQVHLYLHLLPLVWGAPAAGGGREERADEAAQSFAGRLDF